MFVHAFLRVEGQGKERETSSGVSITRKRGKCLPSTWRERVIDWTETNREGKLYRSWIFELAVNWCRCRERSTLKGASPRIYPNSLHTVTQIHSTDLAVGVCVSLLLQPPAMPVHPKEKKKKKSLLKRAREHVSTSKHSAGAKKATVVFISHGAFELLNTSYIWCWCEQKPSSN